MKSAPMLKFFGPFKPQGFKDGRGLAQGEEYWEIIFSSPRHETKFIGKIIQYF
jgi:hypothetical protein